MFDWLKKETVKIVEKEKIVVVGDSVVDVYVIDEPRPSPGYKHVLISPVERDKIMAEYELELTQWQARRKYYIDPVEAFKNANNYPVYSRKAIKCSDGNCYLLEAKAVITIEGDAIEE